MSQIICRLLMYTGTVLISLPLLRSVEQCHYFGTLCPLFLLLLGTCTLPYYWITTLIWKIDKIRLLCTLPIWVKSHIFDLLRYSYWKYEKKVPIKSALSNFFQNTLLLYWNTFFVYFQYEYGSFSKILDFTHTGKSKVKVFLKFR